MSELKKALDDYILANNNLLQATSALEKLNIFPPVVNKEIHVCACADDVWETIIAECDSEPILVYRGENNKYPYRQDAMYGDYKIFRLLEVTENE